MRRDDFALHVQAVFDLDAQETRTAENLAMLVDRDDFWLNNEYRDWITDPEDPEVKAAIEERKRKGIKPPPMPIIPPVAQRDPDLTATLVEIYTRRVEESAPKPPSKPKLKSLISQWQTG